MRLFSKLSSQLSVILIVSLSSIGTSSADDLMYIRAGTLIDVQTGLLRRDQVITIRGDRIESVDDAKNINIEPNATVIDLGGVVYKNQ